MPVFKIDVYVFNLRFRPTIHGSRDDYSDKELDELKNNIAKQIESFLISNGYVKGDI